MQRGVREPYETHWFSLFIVQSLSSFYVALMKEEKAKT